MAESNRPEDAFIVTSWDGVTNPFPSEPQAGWDWGSKDWEAARHCIQHFSQQFQSAFLKPNEPSAKTDPHTPVPQPPLPACPSLPSLNWSQRLQRLQRLAQPAALPHNSDTNWPTLGQNEEAEPQHWTWQDLANTFPWQRPLQPVRVFLNANFTRMFSAVGPHLFLFLTEQDLRGSSLIAAAQLVHEFGHLDHGNSIGWQKFQDCSRLEVERHAIQAELAFLRQRCSALGLVWESSWIRREWNDSYALLAPELSPQEAADYLRIIEQADPVTQ
jgi:hypothetical protein